VAAWAWGGGSLLLGRSWEEAERAKDDLGCLEEAGEGAVETGKW